MIKNIDKYIFVFFGFIFSLASCDILRFSRFEVISWSPGSGYHAAPQDIDVSVSFSHEPDIESVEKSFSVTADNEQVKGAFFWNGKTLHFSPFIPLGHDKDCLIKISANASDKTGLSMDREFEGAFSTRSVYTRAKILSSNPEMEGIMREPKGSYRIQFSFPVSLNSLRSNASFDPSMQGAWHLEEEGAAAVFTPLEPWLHGKRYEFKLPASMAGVNGIEMGKDFFSVFTAGADCELPYLAGAWKVSGCGDETELISEPLGGFIENPGWEKDDRLKLIFSSEVNLLSVNSAVTAENGPSLIMEMPMPGSNDKNIFSQEIMFRLEKPPAFCGRFTVRLKKGIKDYFGNESSGEFIFKIFANGENSKPPSLVGIRIPISPNGTVDDSGDLGLHAYGNDQLFADLPVDSENYPYNTKTGTWIECYFDCAPGVSIDLFSVMEKFRIETSNNVLSFSPKAVRGGNFTIEEPHAGWEQYARVEISGSLTNTVNAGIVHFVFNQGLSDSSGNTSVKQFRISLLN